MDTPLVRLERNFHSSSHPWFSREYRKRDNFRHMRNVLLQKVYFACTRKREPFGAAEGFIVEQLGPVLKEQDPPLFPPEVTCSAFVKFNGGCFVALTHSNGQQKVTVINHCDYLLCLSDTTALAGWIEKPSHLHF